MAFFNVTPQEKAEALYPVLTQDADQTARQRETSASWYEGVGTGVVNGLKSGYYRDMFATAQATGEADLQQKSLQAIQDNKPDPTTIGVVGQVLHGFGDQIMTLFGAAAGGDVTPQLMAMRGGVNYAASQKQLHIAEGMDAATAESVANTEGAGVGLGAVLPGAVAGKLLVRAGSGAAINAVTGIGQRALISDTLRKAGYDDMAKQYEVMDGTALATDIALGAFFGGLLGPRGTKIDVPPSTADAALVSRQQIHMEVDSAPGIPTNTRSRNAHVAAMDASIDALARGERVDVEPIIRGSEFADKPIPEGVDLEAVIRAELDRVGARDVIDDLRRLETEAQARGLAVEADALPEVPKSKVSDVLVDFNERDGKFEVTTDSGKVFGVIEADGVHIRGSEVAKDMQGKGEGVRLYKSLVDEAHKRGLKVFSDATVEPEAARVYDALKRRGYDVKLRDGSERTTGGAAFGKDAIEPAFEVTRAATDAKLQPPEVEKPSMTIPDETGKPVLAADAMASVDAEVKQAGELSKVMDVAVDCAMRFGQ